MRRRLGWVVFLSLWALSGSAAQAKSSKVLPVAVHGQQTNWWCWAASGQMIFSYLGASKLKQCEEANHEFKRDDCCGSGACTQDSDCIPSGAKSCAANSDCVPAGAPSCQADTDCPHNEFCMSNKCSPNLCRNMKCTAKVCGDACAPATCNRGGGTEFTPWDFSAQGTSCDNVLTFKQLKAEIDANRPVEFAWSFACSDPKSSSCGKLCGHPVSGGHVLVAIGYNDDPGGVGQMVFINDPWPPKQGTQYWLSYADWITQKSDNPDSACADAIGCEAHWTQGHTYKIQNVPYCHSDNFGFAGDFQHCFDYQALRGKFPVAISFMNDGTVASSFQSVPSRPVRDRMSYDAWNAAFAKNKSAGWRPDSVSVLNKGGTPEVTSIWTPAEGDFHSFCAMATADLTKNDKTYRGQGFMMTDFFGYTVGPATFFCATWVKKAGKYDLDYDKTADQYNALFKTKSKTMAAVRFSAYDTPAGRRYAVLWNPPSSSWIQYFDMTPTYYQAQHDALYAKGYVQRAITSLDGLYSVTWEKP